ncbi:hypothetical protein [Frigoriglobus tundricola]|uniref:Uncharacterized protein n=1 Tax=Frigoriglobus tundricola TaxID=2774151 RepID=A0A6M5YVS8_9BACT|nr:hypothetical protein [Frigoriglobus tundricola]QJW98038.1 hypothetical protein FTUN_5618 [Frigoriglobus tundricola]
MEEKTSRPARFTAIAAVAVTAVLLFAPLPAGGLGIWQGQILDFGHVPLFAVLVVALRAGMGPPLYRPLGAALALAGIAEVIQPFVGRTGDWLDLLRGALGAFSAAAAIRAWESRRTRLQALAFLVLAVALPLGPIAEAAPYVMDTLESQRAFPVLATFSTDRELLRWERSQATLSRSSDGGHVDFLTGPGEYPGVALRPGVGNFSGYRWLCYEFRVVGAPVALATSVRTGTGAPDRTAHADVQQQYASGSHVARLDLEQLAAQGRPERLDLSDVRAVILFMVRPQQPRTIVLTRVWLEP